MTTSAISAGVRAAAPAVTTSASADGAGNADDPLAGRIHVFGKPVSAGGFAASVLGGASVAGTGAFLLTRGLRTTPVLAAITAGAAVGGGIVGGMLSTFLNGPKVGTASGRNSHFVKTGTEPYNTTCTETIRVNVGDTDGDGFDNYRTSTRTYPCVKIRDVGYNEWRGASGDLYLGRQRGDSDGYDTLDAAKAAVTEGGTLFVHRADGRYYAYGSSTSGLQRVDELRPNAPGVSKR
jgi:hypothetical protein